MQIKGFIARTFQKGQLAMVKETTIRGLSSAQLWNYENAFYWFSHPTRLGKMLAHYEIYKSITGIPGHVVELGVYKGASLMRLATFRHLLENDFSRKIIGFDAFGKFPTDQVSLTADHKFIERFEREGGEGLSVEELYSAIEIKGLKNIDLVKGNVFTTIPDYLNKNAEVRISFLHLDLDVKEPTEFALEMLYPRVVPGGVIVFDDYNAVAGATEAADAFVEKHGLKLEKLPYYNVPAFVRR